MSDFKQTIKTIGRTFEKFTERANGIKMRFYQALVAAAVIKSILNNQGLTIVLVISRQGGKDELLANLVTYLLKLFSHREVGIVYANPTYKPQTIRAIMRVENRLSTNLITRAIWKKRSDFMRLVGKAWVSFLSGDKKANVVGDTASLLLIVNEAQDITPAKYDKDFEPMAASTNATKLIVGTEWTNNTLLAREEDAARELEKKDGIRRVFIFPSTEVRKVVPEYGKFVDSVVKKLGRQHPLVKTQYFCERIDAVAGMFTARRLALMLGDKDPQDKPIAGRLYAFTIDVAGVDETTYELEGLANPARNKTTLDIIEVDLSQLKTLQKPIYRCVKRLDWQGDNHVDIFNAITTLVSSWKPQYIVEDKSGVGEGLFSMLIKKYPSKTIGVQFTAKVKSDIGYSYIGIIEAGRFRDCASTEEVVIQYQNCTSEILIGPQKIMRWGVKDGLRDNGGNPIFDDFILADSLVTELDKLVWLKQTKTSIVQSQDVIFDMDTNY